jgi:hypothetical protein
MSTIIDTSITSAAAADSSTTVSNKKSSATTAVSSSKRRPPKDAATRDVYARALCMTCRREEYEWSQGLIWRILMATIIPYGILCRCLPDCKHTLAGDEEDEDEDIDIEAGEGHSRPHGNHRRVPELPPVPHNTPANATPADSRHISVTDQPNTATLTLAPNGEDIISTNYVSIDDTYGDQQQQPISVVIHHAPPTPNAVQPLPPATQGIDGPPLPSSSSLSAIPSLSSLPLASPSSSASNIIANKKKAHDEEDGRRTIIDRLHAIDKATEYWCLIAQGGLMFWFIIVAFSYGAYGHSWTWLSIVLPTGMFYVPEHKCSTVTYYSYLLRNHNVSINEIENDFFFFFFLSCPSITSTPHISYAIHFYYKITRLVVG